MGTMEKNGLWVSKWHVIHIEDFMNQFQIFCSSDSIALHCFIWQWLKTLQSLLSSHNLLSIPYQLILLFLMSTSAWLNHLLLCYSVWLLYLNSNSIVLFLHGQTIVIICLLTPLDIYICTS
jgi:hypothetical protein